MTHSQSSSFQRIAVWAILLLCITGAWPATQAQTFSVLHTYTGTPDGAQPFQSSMLNLNGALYGTAIYGGLYGYGMLFRLDSSGQTVLYNFTGGTDGAYPDTNLILDAQGNLYGTTTNGGDLSCFISATPGCGVVFKLNSNGLTVLYSFTDGADGASPQGLAMDSVRNLYGGTYLGGDPTCQCGVVYKVDAITHQQSALYVFKGGTDGGSPNGFVTVDAMRNVYGAALIGGNLADCSGVGCGAVFKVDASGNESTLYNFTGGADGSLPNAAFLMDAKGNLYGTAITGGDLNCQYEAFAPGCGTVYEVTTAGKFRLLYTFHGLDGANPNYGLISDAKGNFYSTTSYGGTYGNGTVFELTTRGVEKVLHSFTGGTDGAVPFSGMTLDSRGNLYSNTFQGGDLSCNSPNGCGTAFKIVP